MQKAAIPDNFVSVFNHSSCFYSMALYLFSRLLSLLFLSTEVSKLPTLHDASWCKIHDKDGTGKLGGCIINLLCLLALYTLWQVRVKIISARSLYIIIIWGFAEHCAFGNTHFYFASSFTVWSSWAQFITNPYHSKLIWHSSCMIHNPQT